MKKVIVSAVLAMGLLFNINANAEPSAAGLVIPNGVLPAAFILAAMQVEYKPCNDKETIVKHATGSNYFFSVSQCELDANPGKFIKQ